MSAARDACGRAELALVPIGRGCSAREGVIWSPGSLAPVRRGYSGRPPGRRSPPALAPAGPGQPRAEGRRFRARDRCWACGGPRQQRSPAAPPSRGVVQEPPQAPSRPRASPQAPPTPVHKLPRRMEMPLEPPTPAWARGFASEWVAPRRWPEALRSRRGCLGTFSAHRSLGSGRPTVPRCFLGDMRLLRRFRGRFCLVGLLRCLSPLLGQVQKFRNGRISQYFRKGALSTQNSQ